jgi:hypothetical protein
MLKYIKEFFGKTKDTKKGDELVSRFIEIMKEENIEFKKNNRIMFGIGYETEIDDKLIFFSKSDRKFAKDCKVTIYNKNQQITSRKYAGVIQGSNIGKYDISNKTWKKLEAFYIDQNPDTSLDDFSDLNRSAKKYNL